MEQEPHFALKIQLKSQLYQQKPKKRFVRRCKFVKSQSENLWNVENYLFEK